MKIPTGTELLKGLLKYALTVLSLLLVIRYFELGFWGTYALFVAYLAIMEVWARKFKVAGFLKSCTWLFAVFAVFKALSYLGPLGWVLGIMGSVALILGTRWKHFLEGKRQVEASIWGAPLKEYIAQGKRPPRLKIRL